MDMDDIEKYGMLNFVMGVAFKSLDKQAKLPTKDDGDIGWDLYCIADNSFEHISFDGSEWDTLVLKPGESHIFHTGISSAIPYGYAALLWDRSGMGAKKNIHRLAGVIDSTYRGEWMVSLINLSKESHIINAGDKIIQFIVQKEIFIKPEWVDELDETERGAKGFGSSGQ